MSRSFDSLKIKQPLTMALNVDFFTAYNRQKHAAIKGLKQSSELTVKRNIIILIFLFFYLSTKTSLMRS